MSMYREHILEHYRHPHNFGSLDSASAKHRENNPLCGDEITVEISIKDSCINDIKFSGEGCAISIAAVSLLTEYVKDKSLDQVMDLDKQDVLDLLGIDVSPVRLKCALLGLEVIQKAVDKVRKC